MPSSSDAAIKARRSSASAAWYANMRFCSKRGRLASAEHWTAKGAVPGTSERSQQTRPFSLSLTTIRLLLASQRTTPAPPRTRCGAAMVALSISSSSEDWARETAGAASSAARTNSRRRCMS